MWSDNGLKTESQSWSQIETGPQLIRLIETHSRLSNPKASPLVRLGLMTIESTTKETKMFNLDGLTPGHRLRTPNSTQLS